MHEAGLLVPWNRRRVWCSGPVADIIRVVNDVGVTSSNLIAAAPQGGGAALDQVIGMSAAAGVISLFLLYLAVMHRTRRITWLQRLADYAGEKTNRPGWVALPMVMFMLRSSWP